jgi:predicted Rossmann fold flavoprotein
MRAQDLLDVLIHQCDANNVEIRYNESVYGIVKSESGFVVETGNAGYESSSVMIATGGKSYPLTGATGDGYIFAKKLGHAVSHTAPSLTPVIVRNYALQECSGISIRDAVARLYRNGKKINQMSGDLLFTHKGLSGPLILDMSRYIEADDCLRVQLTDCSDPHEFENILIDGGVNEGNKSVKNYIADQSIPERLAAAIVETASLLSDLTLARLDKKSRKILSDLVTGFPFIVERLGDYNEAMATRGGVALNEVNPKSMESRIVNGLYFGGEVLDVDGDTGGYNIQFAFSSGKCAADHIVAQYSGRQGR